MRVRFTIQSDGGGVEESIEAVVDGLSDLTPFFEALRPDWTESRERMYQTQGASTNTPWPLYSDTEESLRYVFAKAAILGLTDVARVSDDDVLLWNGPSRLHDGVTGRSSEFAWIVSPQMATMRVEIPYASNHDRGEGDAPEWAWPEGRRYRIPQRRLSSIQGDFPLAFSARLSAYLGETGGRLGLKTAAVAAEILRATTIQDQV